MDETIFHDWLTDKKGIFHTLGLEYHSELRLKFLPEKDALRHNL